MTTGTTTLASEDEDDHHEEEFAHAEFFSGGMFTGDTRLWGVDFRYSGSPTGNANESELILQGEYFLRREDGVYTLIENDEGMEEEHAESLNGASSGRYAQAVYRFMPRWRVGVRYSQLNPPSDADLSHTPYAIGVMGDWTNSEFGRIRLQYNREALDGGDHDDQFILQYVMSLGAHAAHLF